MTSSTICCKTLGSSGRCFGSGQRVNNLFNCSLSLRQEQNEQNDKLCFKLSLTVAGLRIVPERWNKEANLLKFECFARAAAAQDVQLAIAPEGFLEGYVVNTKSNPCLMREKYFAIGEKIDGPALMRVRSLARELKMCLGLGFAERVADHMYNSVAVFSPDGVVAVHYSKATTTMTSHSIRSATSSTLPPPR
jgi:predicted amidohydrolase